MPLPAGCSLRPENRECSSKRVGGKNPSISPIADFLQGFLGTAQAGIETHNDVTVAVRNWFANRNPLVTRLPYVPVERVDFLV